MFGPVEFQDHHRDIVVTQYRPAKSEVQPLVTIRQPLDIDAVFLARQAVEQAEQRILAQALGKIDPLRSADLSSLPIEGEAIQAVAGGLVLYLQQALAILAHRQLRLHPAATERV